MTDSIASDLKKKEQYLREDSHYRKIEDLYHQKQAGNYIRDLVYGANDGIITTFAVVAGATGASLSPLIVIIMGFANLLADGISMGASNYLGTKSEIDYQKAQRVKEEWEINHLCNIEIQEIKDIYRERGFEGEDLEKAVKLTISNRKRWIDVMMKDELGIIETSVENPLKHGLATFLAFVVAGLIPLFSYILPNFADKAFFASVILTTLALAVIGGLRTLISLKKWWRGSIEMLLVGGIAAVVAYFLGGFIKNLVR